METSLQVCLQRKATSLKVVSTCLNCFRRVWDVTDYVIPPSENEAFFVTTNVILTPNQTLGKCPEDPFVQGAVECDPRNPGESVAKRCPSTKRRTS